MEPVVIDFEYLKGRQNEIVVKEAAVAGKDISESFRFEPPYYMAPHSSAESGLNWDDGNISYQNCPPFCRRRWQISPTSTA